MLDLYRMYRKEVSLVKISSEQARANWRDILDQAAAGQQIIIERYGKAVAVIGPYEAEPAAGGLQEPRAVYEVAGLDDMKEEILQTLRAELLEGGDGNWLAGWRALQAQLKASNWSVGVSKDEVVAQLRQSREAIFEAEYAHLYR